jgi:hypothetical protein
MASNLPIHLIGGLRRSIAGVPTWAALALLLAAVLLTLRLAMGGSAYAQSPDWPTPPPGPPFPVPSEVALLAQVTSPVSGNDAQVAVVQVSWPGSLPLIPPVPSNDVSFNDASIGPVALRIDAGTFPETVQLMFRPATPAVLPRSGHVLAAFELTAFDVAGSPLDGALSRPIRVSMPTGPWAAIGVDPLRILGAVADRDTLRLIATEFTLHEESITFRLTALGTVMIIAETAPGSGG